MERFLCAPTPNFNSFCKPSGTSVTDNFAVRFKDGATAADALSRSNTIGWNLCFFVLASFSAPSNVTGEKHRFFEAVLLSVCLSSCSLLSPASGVCPSDCSFFSCFSRRISEYVLDPHAGFWQWEIIQQIQFVDLLMPFQILFQTMPFQSLLQTKSIATTHTIGEIRTTRSICDKELF